MNLSAGRKAPSPGYHPSRLIYGLVAAGAKWVDLKSPGFQKMEGASVAVASGVNLAYGGVQDE